MILLNSKLTSPSFKCTDFASHVSADGGATKQETLETFCQWDGNWDVNWPLSATTPKTCHSQKL